MLIALCAQGEDTETENPNLNPNKTIDKMWFTSTTVAYFAFSYLRSPLVDPGARRQRVQLPEQHLELLGRVELLLELPLVELLPAAVVPDLFTLLCLYSPLALSYLLPSVSIFSGEPRINYLKNVLTQIQVLM